MKMRDLMIMEFVYVELEIDCQRKMRGRRRVRGRRRRCRVYGCVSEGMN